MKQAWIIDDDQEMVNAVSMMLNLLDFQSTCFLNARNAAQTLLTGQHPDIIVLDINMPEVSGLDLLEFMRRRSEWQVVPIIMLSSEAADLTIDKAFELGADGYAVKPVTIGELEKVITMAFENHKKG